MSKYDKETKFYWLQLKEDFFEDDAIEWLEEQEPNGRDYAYFYLKLCLKSLKSNGILIRNVGNILIPYDNKKLAELTKIDFDTVTIAMELLKRIGLIKILEHGEIYMTNLENLIGSVSKSALKKQQQRAIKNTSQKTIGWTKGGQVSTKDKDKVKDRYIYNICRVENNADTIKEVIDYTNKLGNTSFKYTTKKTRELINARINDGCTLEDLKKLVYYSWDKYIKNEKDFNGTSSKYYYRPETIFNNKFEAKLEEYNRKANDEGR